MLSSVHIAVFRDFSGCFHTANVCSPCTSADVISRSQDVSMHLKYVFIHVVARTCHLLKKRSSPSYWRYGHTLLLLWSRSICYKKKRLLNNVVLVYLLMHQFLLGKMYCEIQRTASGSIVRACARSNPSRETAKDANIKVQPPI